MKSKVIVFASLLTLASFASAKTTYVTGAVKHIDEKNLQIAIEKDSGAVKQYNVNPEAMSEIRRIREGDSVTLELKTGAGSK